MDSWPESCISFSIIRANSSCAAIDGKFTGHSTLLNALQLRGIVRSVRGKAFDEQKSCLGFSIVWLIRPTTDRLEDSDFLSFLFH
jgi:hypothetical protein